MFTMTTNYHIKHEPQADIDVVQVTPEQGSCLTEPYPRIHIGEVTLFPSAEQIVAIRDACERYLAAHRPVEHPKAALDRVLDLMQRYRTDGSCEYEIRDMLLAACNIEAGLAGSVGQCKCEELAESAL